MERRFGVRGTGGSVEHGAHEPLEALRVEAHPHASRIVMCDVEGRAEEVAVGRNRLAYPDERARTSPLVGSGDGLVRIAVGDPLAPDVRALIEGHIARAREVTLAGHAHALDVEGMLDPLVTVFAAHRARMLVGVGAIKELDSLHGELKSIHTVSDVRRQGVGRAIVNHLIGVARERGYLRVSLETGTMDEFLPARTMYTAMGFVPCQPFGPYASNPHSVCMTKEL